MSLPMNDRTLKSIQPVKSPGLRLPVDSFFRSLADDMQEKSIGIILSGMGSDGSQGLNAMKEKNGIVRIQDPASAKFQGMPDSALEAVNADFVAPAGELPLKLIEYLKFNVSVVKNPEIESKNISNLDKIILPLRQFTHQVTNTFKLRDADIGRPLSEVVTVLQYPEIDSHSRQVISTLIFVETAITTDDGRWFSVRMMPYRMHNSRIDGLVITFIDITIEKSWKWN
jgi:hypothetical protein